MKSDGVFAYFHGGPGLNSRAEEELLLPQFSARGARAVFWNEPSSLRNTSWPFSAEDAFENLLSSAKELLQSLAGQGLKVHAICHSFAIQAIGRIAMENPSLIQEITAIAPSTDFPATMKSVIQIAISDFRDNNPQAAAKLGKLLGRSSRFFDAPMQEAFNWVAQDSALLTNYFKDKNALQAYFSVWAKEGLSIDAPSFFAVCSAFSRAPALIRKDQKIQAAVQVILGSEDPVFSERSARLFGNLFARHTVHVFQDAAHFPHLEQTSRFFETLGLG